MFLLDRKGMPDGTRKVEQWMPHIGPDKTAERLGVSLKDEAPVCKIMI